MNILIVKTSSLGDIVHAFYALRYLRGKFPKASIDWVVEKPYAELLLSHPLVDNVFVIDTRRWRRGRKLGAMLQFIKTLRRKKYAVLFDLQGNLKSGLITLVARADKKAGFSRRTAPESINALFTNWQISVKPGENIRLDLLEMVQSFFDDHEMLEISPLNLNISQREKEKIEALLEHPNIVKRKKILISFGSRWPNKKLPDDLLTDFLKFLSEDENRAFLFIWGNDREKKTAHRLAKLFAQRSIAVNRLNLPSLQNLIRQVDLVIANDSFPLHLAGESLRPTFSFFGPSLARKYKPPGEIHFALQGKCPYLITFGNRCPKLRSCASGACIKSFTLDDLKKCWEDFKPDSV